MGANGSADKYVWSDGSVDFVEFNERMMDGNSREPGIGIANPAYLTLGPWANSVTGDTHPPAVFRSGSGRARFLFTCLYVEGL